MAYLPEVSAAFPLGVVGWNRRGALALSASLIGERIDRVYPQRSGFCLLALVDRGRMIHFYDQTTHEVSIWRVDDLAAVRHEKSIFGNYIITIQPTADESNVSTIDLTSELGDEVLRVLQRARDDLVSDLAESPSRTAKGLTAAPSDRGQSSSSAAGLGGASPEPAVRIGGELTESPPSTSTPEGLRTYEIHALGPSGSGKTILMASLYHRLRIRRPELAFYLKSDHESSKHLNTIYNMVSNPTEPWPEASRGIHEWRFRTCLQSPSGDFEPIEFCYLDYPGGVLTNPDGSKDAAVQPLVERLRSANALLVLLDGQAIKALMAGEPLGRRYLGFDLTSSLEIAQQSRCPVHFVITKWDLLEGQSSLGDIAARLLEDENFGDLIAAKAEDTPATIRLFPVSAVGLGFANQTESGAMRKIGDRPSPVNVELPLLSVIPDFMQFAFDEIEQREAQLTGAKIAPSSRLLTSAASEKLEPTVLSLLHRAAPTLRAALIHRFPYLGSMVSESLFHDAVGFGGRMITTQRQRMREGQASFTKELMRRRQHLASDLEALELLEQQCLAIISGYEEANPASVLAGGLTRLIEAAADAPSSAQGSYESSPESQPKP